MYFKVQNWLLSSKLSEQAWSYITSSSAIFSTLFYFLFQGWQEKQNQKSAKNQA